MIAAPRTAEAPVAMAGRKRGLVPLALIAIRELKLMRRGKTARGMLILLIAVAWLPPLLVPLRGGSLGVAPFREITMLTLALAEVVVPLVSLLAGADLLAGEIEDGTAMSVVTLPVSRRTFLLGKCLGRTIQLAAAYIAVFVSAGIAIGTINGFSGGLDYAAIASAGLLLMLSCGAIGVALGALGRARVRAFGSAIAAWIVLVFVLDALLLAAVVASAPAPPSEVGAHGHEEFSAQTEMMRLHSLDEDDQSSSGRAESRSGQSGAWLAILDPVDLFRTTALSIAPGLGKRAAIGIDGSVWQFAILAAAWIIWIAVPLAFALRRFRSTVLQ